MKKALIAGGVFAVLLLLALALWRGGTENPVQDPGPAAAAPAAEAAPQATDGIASSRTDSGSADPGAAVAASAHQGFIYGRVHTADGNSYEGRLRWGGGEEAFWGDYFNGTKAGNRWADEAPPEALTERRPLELFGVEIAQRERQIDLGRPFMSRFGDIRKIEAEGRDLRVTLKSGTVFHLDRYQADDFADGVRVWDARDDEGGPVDLAERQIRSIELLPTARLGATPDRLHGTVRTAEGDFTGFVQWNREEGAGSDTMDGWSGGEEVSLRFDDVRSIERHAGGSGDSAEDSADGSRVTLVDGSRLVLSGSPEAGEGNRGLYVEDPRYGRVLVSWEAFRRVEFSPGGSGPAYGDFPPGSPLKGTVTTRDGRRLSGRLVYDLDESETTETLDAPSGGVDYTIHFGLVASVARPEAEAGDGRVTVTLHGGGELALEPGGDLGPGNAGLLVFTEGRQRRHEGRPAYVPWSEVRRINLDRPPAMYPPLGEG